MGTGQLRARVRVFFHTRHAEFVDVAEPMTPAHRALLAARQVDWARALASRGYAGPPTSTDRAGV